MERELAAQPPERLMHVIGRQMLPGIYRVYALVLDEHAQANATSCQPSAEGELAIHEAEIAHDGRYIGIVHSHPVDIPELSEQDGQAAWDSLERNPHLDAFFVGVVTSSVQGVLAQNGVTIGSGQLSVHVAHRTGGELSTARCTVGTADFLETLAARMPAGSVECLVPRKVAVFGAGSLGSAIAESVVRNGVGAIHLMDPDRVEGVNLSRSVYTSADVGLIKVQALADRLHKINPLAAITALACAVGDATIGECQAICEWADLIIAVTDDPRAQAILDVLVYEADTPAVFAGVMPGGHAGEVVITLPGLTTCYRCSAGNVRLTASHVETDYSNGRPKERWRSEPTWHSWPARPRSSRSTCLDSCTAMTTASNPSWRAEHGPHRPRSTGPRPHRGPRPTPPSAHAPVGLDAPPALRGLRSMRAAGAVPRVGRTTSGQWAVGPPQGVSVPRRSGARKR